MPTSARERDNRRDLTGSALARSRTARTWAFTLVVGAAAVVALRAASGVRAPLENDAVTAWIVLAVAFALAELLVVHIEFRKDAHSFNLSEIPLVVGLFTVPPLGLVSAQLAGAGVALLAGCRQSPLKLSFNAAQFVLSTSLAILCFDALVPRAAPTGVGGWGAAFLAGLVGAGTGALLTFVVISISEGRAGVGPLRSVAELAVAASASNSALGIISVLVLHSTPGSEPAAMLLLLVPALTMFVAYRAYTAQREQRKALRFLYECTRTLHQSPDLESAVAELLGLSRDTFRAELAEITFFTPGGGDDVLRSAVGPGSEVEIMQPAALENLDPIWSEVTNVTGARLLGARSGGAVRSYLEGRGLRDAMVSVLHGETRPVGVMVLGNRLGDVNSFGREDLHLFETLASQLGVALQKGHLEQSLAQLRQLQEQLTHQALHDSLTGLANRVLFQTRLAEALHAAGASPGRNVAVLFVDLDDFKEVNDSFGHEAGDEVLRVVAARLRHSLRPTDLAARLGGDEFAVLLEGVHGEAEAVAVAQRVLTDLGAPVALPANTARIGASIGLALAERSSTVDEVLHRADLAMYEAKRRGKNLYRVFTPELSRRMSA